MKLLRSIIDCLKFIRNMAECDHIGVAVLFYKDS